MTFIDVILLITTILLGAITAAVLAAIIFLIISISLFLRDKRREIKAKEVALDELRFGVPSFEKLDSGDTINIGDRPWKIREIESFYDIDFDMDKVRITLSSDRER